MFEMEHFNKMFFPMEFGLVFQNGDYYLIDYPSNNTVKLKKEGNILKGSLQRNDVNYHFQIGPNSIILETSENEKISMIGSEFSYHKRRPNENYNQFFINVNTTGINFYINENEEIGNHSIGIKTDKGFAYAKAFETIIHDGTYKKDIIVQYENDMPIKNIVTRQYNEKGALVSSNLEEEDLCVSIEDYLKENFSSNKAVSCLQHCPDGFHVPGSVSLDTLKCCDENCAVRRDKAR